MLKISSKHSVWISIVLLSLVPLGAVALGLRETVNGILITPAFMIGYFLLPFGTIAGFFFLITSRMKLWGKIVLSILLFTCFVTLDFWTLLFGTLEDLDHYKNAVAMEAYEEQERLVEIMPDPEKLGMPEQTEYYRYDFSSLFFWEAETLICQYSEADYMEEKARLEECYVFQEEPFRHYSTAQLCEPTAEIDGYTFRTLCVEVEYKDEIRYPDQLMFVGTNDETQEIVYLATDDPERDYIASLDEYILEICGWKYIR